MLVALVYLVACAVDQGQVVSSSVPGAAGLLKPRRVLGQQDAMNINQRVFHVLGAAIFWIARPLVKIGSRELSMEGS